MPSIKDSAWEQSAAVPPVSASLTGMAWAVHCQMQLAVQPPFVRAMAWFPPRAPVLWGWALM